MGTVLIKTMGTVLIKTLVVFVTNKAGTWTDQVQIHSLKACVMLLSIDFRIIS
jgi:hypothetical protein